MLHRVVISYRPVTSHTRAQVADGDHQRQTQRRPRAPPVLWSGYVLEADHEIAQALPAPINFSEIKPWGNFADLIANHRRDERGLGVIEDDALLAVEPALVFADLRFDPQATERGDAVDQPALGGVKVFALPKEPADEPGDEPVGNRGRANDRGAAALAVVETCRRALFETGVVV